MQLPNKLGLSLAFLVVCATSGFAQTQISTQGPVQYSSNCGQSLRYGTMSVCYDTNYANWYYWSYPKAHFVPAFMSGTGDNGVIAATAYGVAGANADNSTAMQNAINAAYRQGTASATKGMVMITPDATGATTYNFTAGVDFKGVPVSCAAGRSSGNSAGQFNITLNFIGSGYIAIQNAQPNFDNCRIIGGFTTGKGQKSTISNIVDGANNQATVTLSATPTLPLIAGMTVVISGTTNYNGAYPVASVTDATDFVIDTGKAGTATETSGTANYYPSVGVMAAANSSITAVSAVHWSDLFVQGFGTDYSLSSVQTGAGSVNNWRAETLYAGNAIVGVIGNGNGFIPPGSNSNVSNGKLAGLQCVNVSICLYGGPMVDTLSNISDSEETSFGDNDITGIDFESVDTNSNDSGLVVGIWAGSYGNVIHDVNYVSGGSSAGSGQTAMGQIRTREDVGPNFILRNRVGSVSTGLVINTAMDVADGNVPGVSANQRPGMAFTGGISLGATPQTPNLISSTCNGSCATSGSGGTIHVYAIVGIDQSGQRSTLSPNFICPADASGNIAYVSSGGKASCPAGSLGPTTYSGSNFQTVCWASNLNYKAYDIYIDDNAHYVRQNFASGGNNNNCFPDTSASSTSTTAPSQIATGGILQTSSTAINHFTPVAVASLPTTCSVGDWTFVSDWNGTPGTCVNGGTHPTIAVCGASNTWNCP